MTDGIAIEGTVGTLLIQRAHFDGVRRGIHVAAGASVQGIYAEDLLINSRRTVPAEAVAELRRLLRIPESVSDEMLIREANTFCKLIPEHQISFARRLGQSIGIAAELATNASRLSEIIQGWFKSWSA
jgi:hypothetical protein